MNKPPCALDALRKLPRGVGDLLSLLIKQTKEKQR